MSEDAVLLEIDDDEVATVTLNRPDMRNALSAEIADGLADAFGDVGDSDARVVVVEGAGGAFSAGGDVNAMAERMAGEISLAEAVHQINDVLGSAMARVAECPLPTVAKVDGPAFGAGANLAVACDVQLASADAKISFGFRQVGLRVDTGTSYFLPRIVGENVAKELVFTGELLDAEKAAELGLFNHVYPAAEFEELADEFVEQIATGPTIALRNSKRLIRQGLDSSLAEAMADEAAAQAAVFESHDHEEGATAFMEGRRPEFEGR
jgi:enoyl-CoA hydratase/carnithine racemase